MQYEFNAGFVSQKFPVLCCHECLGDHVWMPGDHNEVGPRRLVGLGAALLSIPQCADRNRKALSERHLRQAQRPADDESPRPWLAVPTRDDRLRIGIARRSSRPVRISHRIEVGPVGGHLSWLR